jgi:hypothetical protein
MFNTFCDTATLNATRASNTTANTKAIIVSTGITTILNFSGSYSHLLLLGPIDKTVFKISAFMKGRLFPDSVHPISHSQPPK